MKSRYQLIVFDWDGTLINSCQHIAESIQAAATDMDCPHMDENHIRTHIGCGMFSLVNDLFPTFTSEQKARFMERYKQHFFAGAHDSVLYPGVEDILQQLQNNGYLLAIATGEGRQRLEAGLKQWKIDNLFSITRCADDAPAKPNPQMLFDIMDSLSVKPFNTLMVGDTEYDMQMAINANVSAVAVACGVHDKQRLLRCEPMACLDSVQELPEWLVANDMVNR